MHRRSGPVAPLFAQTSAFVPALTLSIVVFLLCLPARGAEPAPDAAESCMVDAMNQLRGDQGLEPYEWSGLGLDSARRHAAEMRTRGELFHTTAADSADVLPDDWTTWGEVVGMAVGVDDAQQLCRMVFDGFVGSPPHRELITSSDARFVTVGVSTGETDAWYSVRMFDAPDYDPDPPAEETAATMADESPTEFTDDNGSVFEDDIEWLAANGITRGCSPTEFCPDDALTRGEMAAFLVRAFQWDGTETHSSFSDMAGHIFDDAVARLAEVGVTKGCSPTEFCPDDHLTRGQLAAFLSRALHLGPGAGDHFTDDDASVFEGEIEALVEQGITTGCGPVTYCPDEPITRGQMAAMLRRALDH